MIYKFCPKCGGELFEKEQGLLKCRKCGYDFFQDAKPTACVILADKLGRILLVKRGIEPKKGTWDLPGGFLKEEENFEDGARREIKEELRIEIGEIKYLGSYNDDYEYQEINFKVLCVVFVGEYQGEVNAEDDISETRWFGDNEIPWGEFGFESMKKTVNDYLKVRHNVVV